MVCEQEGDARLLRLPKTELAGAPNGLQEIGVIALREIAQNVSVGAGGNICSLYWCPKV